MGGEELVGPSPPGWEYKPLGVACEQGGGDIQTGPFGSQLHASDYAPTGIPSIMPQNLGDNRIIETGISRISAEDAARLGRYLVRTGDIVCSRRGDVERRALVRPHENGWLCGTGCLRVRFGDEGIDPRYASYYLAHPGVREWIVRHAHGATMPNLNTSILAACPFLEPPLAEQRAIAHILGTLDDKIELNRRMSETLEAMARALFKSWFVDFDPVRAKMAGRDPGLPLSLADLFPSRLVDSELGEIPEGWEVGTLASLSALNPEAWTKNSRPPEIEYIDLANTKWGRIDAVTRHASADAPSRAQRILRPGDTIVGTVRPGNGSYALISQAGLTGSTGFAVLRPTSAHCSGFVYLGATSPENIEALAHLADGGAYPAVRPDVVAATSTVLPSDAVLTAFAQATDSLFAAIAQNERESRTLAALRDALLPKLVSGEIRIAGRRAFEGPGEI
jgi:type I restriction enzyme S subunit